METGAREFVQRWWREALSDGLWAASWAKSVEGLTAAQAAWSPAPGRHSIWQIVMHMVFWRESWLRRVKTGKGPSREELAVGNFPVIAEVTEEAWAAARARLAEAHERMGATLADATLDDEQFRVLAHFLPHDCYHFGQISYLRAMLGMAAIE
jgi:uncharacterized damage-inducible protein DinB